MFGPSGWLQEVDLKSVREVRRRSASHVHIAVPRLEVPAVASHRRDRPGGLWDGREVDREAERAGGTGVLDLPRTHEATDRAYDAQVAGASTRVRDEALVEACDHESEDVERQAGSRQVEIVVSNGGASELSLIHI